MANGLQWECLTGAKMATSRATVGVSDWGKYGQWPKMGVSDWSQDGPAGLQWECHEPSSTTHIYSIHICFSFLPMNTNGLGFYCIIGVVLESVQSVCVCVCVYLSLWGNVREK